MEPRSPCCRQATLLSAASISAEPEPPELKALELKEATATITTESTRIEYDQENSQQQQQHRTHQPVKEGGCTDKSLKKLNAASSFGSVFLVLKFLPFRLSEDGSWNFRRRRRGRQRRPQQRLPRMSFLLILRLCLLLLLLAKLISRQNLYTASAQLQTLYESSNDQLQQQQDQLQTAFYHQDPQPLVYMHESGSGDGYSHSSSSSASSLSNFNSRPDNFELSSVSPSLITAKCWDNDNDNDCKQINVITGPNENGQQQQEAKMDDNHDDSIITPVVIFESSSTLEPPVASGGEQQPPPAFLAPPYFSSTLRPDTGNMVLARHRTPPTANDLYAAPPAGATILPGSSGELPSPSPALQGYRWQLTSAQIRPVLASTPPTDQQQQQPVTRLTNSIFVATPQPKKHPKTTTMGRKCRDENDGDCDEPDEDETRGNNADSGADQDEDDDVKSTASAPDDDNDNDNVPSSGGRGGASNSNTKSGGGDDGAELGSGDSPRDDNEDDDDDGEGDSGDFESSGSSEPPVDQTTRYVEVSSGYRPRLPSAKDNNNSNDGDNQQQQSHSITTTQASTLESGQFSAPSTGSSSSPKPGAEIEVVVHPTLPLTFPITTAGSQTPDNSDFSGSQPQLTFDGNEQKAMVSSSTNMPDDTFKSKPVFPSTTQPDENSLDSSINEFDGGRKSLHGSPGSADESSSSSSNDFSNQINGGFETTTEPINLATFTAIPMPEEIRGGSRRPTFIHRPEVVDAGSTGSGGSGGSNNVVGEEHRFNLSEVTMMPPPKHFQAKPWREGKGKPANQFGGPSPEPWSPRGMTPSPALRPDSVQAPRMQLEILPTLLVYASIVILVVMALIFAIMALTLWRRSTARQRALLQKQLNGGPNQMIGSMSHASHLMANMRQQQQHQQQPGLLSTYAPGKGLTMGKITSSVIKAADDNLMEEDDGRILIDHQSNTVKDHQLDGSIIDGNHNIRHQQQRTSSWSTEDPTTSSGSQKTADSQQQGHLNSNIQTHRPQYPNSLSDGRQNSSSISDQSQCSPVDGIHQQRQQPQLQSQNNATTSQYSPERPANYPSDMYDGQQQPLSQAQLLPPAQVQAPIPAPALYSQQHLQQAPVIPDSVKRFNSSRSVENLHHQQQQQDGFIINNRRPYHMGTQQQVHPHLINQQQQLYKQPPPSNMAACSPGPPTFIGGPGSRNPQQPPTNHHYLIQQHQGANDGYPVSGVRLENGLAHGLGPQQGSLAERLQFNGPPVSPARVAMNPLATLSRRYHPGIGLNRNIFSEDSSSFMTASPSLARTSSSSSFAFTTNQQQQAGLGVIRAKPLVDAAGRIFNDYTQTIHNTNGAPPVLGRKDRSEAWYI